MSEADFKTLRSHGPCCIDQGHRVDAHQALDNIEAEVGRLRAERDEAQRSFDNLREENERLRRAGYTLLDAWDEEGTMGQWIQALSAFRAALADQPTEEKA